MHHYETQSKEGRPGSIGSPSHMVHMNSSRVTMCSKALKTWQKYGISLKPSVNMLHAKHGGIAFVTNQLGQEVKVATGMPASSLPECRSLRCSPLSRIHIPKTDAPGLRLVLTLPSSILQTSLVHEHCYLGFCLAVLSCRWSRTMSAEHAANSWTRLISCFMIVPGTDATAIPTTSADLSCPPA